jgi:hypothetical protein
MLDLRYNQITNIEPLENLTNLENLCLDYNQITNIEPLKNLTNLRELGFGNNQISDITPLKELTKLFLLVIYDTPITQTQINELQLSLPNCNIWHNVPPIERDFSNQNITDEILAEMVEDGTIPHDIEVLYLTENLIRDVTPLKSLKNLDLLYLEGNPIILGDLQGLQNALPKWKPWDKFRYFLGDVNGDGIISASDALEIFKYVAGMSSKLHTDGRSFNASLILGSDVPTVMDAIEIMIHLEGVDGPLRGIPAIWHNSYLDVIINSRDDVVEYYIAENIKHPHRVHYDITTSINTPFAQNPFISVVRTGTHAVFMPYKEIDETPKNTLLMTQFFTGHAKDVQITGDSIKSVSFKPGYIRGEKRILISDALELLKFLAGIDSILHTDERSFNAALITEQSQIKGKPSIHDVLLILKHLTGKTRVLR